MKKASDLIIENNHQFVVAEKPSGMPVQADLSNDKSLHQILEAYTKCKLHLHTRLDRPVGGLVLLSKKDSARKHISKLNDTGKIEKKYYAIVEGHPESSGKLVHYLYKDGKRKKSLVSNQEQEKYKHCQLDYQLVKALDRYSILEIVLNSGRFHQIRSQLSHIGFPIKGDVKYGARRKNADRSIHLYAHALSFQSPVGNEMLAFSSRPENPDMLWQQLPEVL